VDIGRTRVVAAFEELLERNPAILVFDFVIDPDLAVVEAA